MKLTRIFIISLLSVFLFSSPLLSNDNAKVAKDCPYLQKIDENKGKFECPYINKTKRESRKKNEKELKCPYSGKSEQKMEQKQERKKELKYT